MRTTPFPSIVLLFTSRPLIRPACYFMGVTHQACFCRGFACKARRQCRTDEPVRASASAELRRDKSAAPTKKPADRPISEKYQWGWSGSFGLL